MQVFKNNFHIINLMRKCRESENTEERIELLQSINRLLPIGYEIEIPSFITNDYIDVVLNSLEERITSSNI